MKEEVLQILWMSDVGLDGMLVGSTIVESVAPGGLSIATCDTQIITSGEIGIRGLADGTASIEESE